MLSAISLFACVEPEGGGGSAAEGVSAEVGEPVGPEVTAVVGPGGGELVSADGVLVLRVPAGALAEDTELSVQAIGNTAWGGIGDGYRLGPALTFDARATLELGWTEADEAGTAPELLGVAVQDDEGFWLAFPDGVVDAESRTLSVEIDTIGGSLPTARAAPGAADFARHWRVSIDPAEATVKRRGLLQLQLVSSTVGEVQSWPFGDGEHGALGPPAPYTHPGAVTWTAGLGSVSGGPSRATYEAPSGYPGSDDRATATFQIGGRTFGPQALIHIADDYERWSGTARQTVQGIAYDFDVTWELTEEQGTQLWYEPTGEARLAMETPCTISPTTHPIGPTDGLLIVDTSVDPPSYSGYGTVAWVVTQDCGTGAVSGNQIGTFLGSTDPLAVLGAVVFEGEGDQQVAVIRDSKTFFGMVVDWEFFGE